MLCQGAEAKHVTTMSGDGKYRHLRTPRLDRHNRRRLGDEGLGGMEKFDDIRLPLL
jgi:hypothetical protein